MIVVTMPAEVIAAPTVAMETDSLAHGRYAEMHARLDKTIFRVKVLNLTLRVDSPTQQKLTALLAGHAYSDPLADQAATLVMASHDAAAHLVFLRDLSVDRLLGGLRDNLAQAHKAGLMTRKQHDLVVANLTKWFDFLQARGIERGDTLLYRIEGDTVRTQYWSHHQQLLMDRVDVGVQGRLGLLAGYLAPGGDFRELLLKSLF